MTFDLLHMFGQAVSIACLAIIASASLNAWQRIEPDAQVPVAFDRKGEPGMRMKKPFALLLMPVVATVLLMVLSVEAGGAATGGKGIVFTLQLLLATGLVAAHLVHLKHVFEVMAREGKLKS